MDLAFLQSKSELFQKNQEYQMLLIELLTSTNALAEERYQHLEKLFLKRESEYFKARINSNSPISTFIKDEGLSAIILDVKAQRDKAFESLSAMAATDIRHQKLRSARDWKLTQILFEKYQAREPQAAIELLSSIYGPNIGLLPPQFYHFASSPDVIADVKSRNGVQLQEEAKEFLKRDRDKIDNLLLLNGIRGMDFARSYDHLEQSDWHVPIREVLHLQRMLDESEKEKGNLMEQWHDTSKYASKADDIAHRIGQLYNDHISACKPASFLNQIFAKLCDTEAGWNSLPETGKRAQVIAKVESLVHDRDRSTSERRKCEQTLASKDASRERIIREREEEVALLREKANVSEKKHREDLAKAYAKYELEHSKRVAQEHEIEEKWSIKVQERNTKISGLEAEVEALKQELKFNQQNDSPKRTDPDRKSHSYKDIVKENALLKKKFDSAKRHIEDGGAKYKALKMEKEVLEAKLTNQLVEADNQRKIILSLRSSDEVVKDRIKKAVQQKAQEKDTEKAEMTKEIEELRHQRIIDMSLIGDLNRDIHELSQSGAGSKSSK
jgi:hypothetical protein